MESLFSENTFVQPILDTNLHLNSNQVVPSDFCYITNFRLRFPNHTSTSNLTIPYQRYNHLNFLSFASRLSLSMPSRAEDGSNVHSPVYSASERQKYNYTHFLEPQHNRSCRLWKLLKFHKDSKLSTKQDLLHLTFILEEQIQNIITINSIRNPEKKILSTVINTNPR